MPAAWNYGVVAFIDVLGFASFVEQDASSLTPQHLDNFLACLQAVRASTPVEHLDVRAFSDSIIISTGLSSVEVTELLVAAVALQRIFIQRGVLVRGAVAFGKHYLDKDLIYSEALVRAYRRERDMARFPRILIDRDLLDWYINDAGTTNELARQAIPLMLRDRDNQVFLHYLNNNSVAAHRDLLLSYKLDGVTASVLEKLQWMAEYHNYFAKSKAPAILFAGPLVADFRPLET